ncbi:LacI family transcriptional regulator [Humibacillus xanthopallidus]|uniref:LacI family transcriptional regulator n=2 Tax=Humibacillus xanthopallidus TaxID=412689 RepID=A0A543PPB4_9MICO|nr:LacI family transcriptional regulator [Humibacillus xanthopallidus]
MSGTPTLHAGAAPLAYGERMPTIADVAREAGVAPSTVSYVLSGKRTISAETRARVEAGIARLGYRPNAGARALASASTKIVGLVVPLRTDVNVPVIMQFVAAITVECRRHDYDVLLLTRDEGPEAVSRVVQGSMADAIIVMDVEADEPRLESLRGTGFPVVLIGVPDSPGEFACVDLDFAAAAQLCVERLAELGHTHISLLGATPAVYDRGTSYALRFRAGFEEASRSLGVSGSVHAVGAGHHEVESVVDRLLREEPEVTGLVVHNEAALSPLLQALRVCGHEVPGGMSVVALCPDDIAETQAVPLDAVSIPANDVGRRAVELAMSQLRGEAVEQELLPPHLTVRGSAVPPRRG